MVALLGPCSQTALHGKQILREQFAHLMAEMEKEESLGFHCSFQGYAPSDLKTSH